MVLVVVLTLVIVFVKLCQAIELDTDPVCTTQIRVVSIVKF